MNSILLHLAVLAAVLLPGAASAQRSGDAAYFDDRINVLQRSLTGLSAQIEQLKTRNQQLQQQLEKMRSNYDQRLERLEKGPSGKKPAPRSGQSRP